MRFVTGMQLLLIVPMVVTQVARSKISSAPSGLGAVEPRFVAVDEKETYRPVFEIAGSELGPSPGVTPSGVDTR